MNLTIKRLANFYGVKKREQLVKLETELNEKKEILRDEYLEELGLLEFYAEAQKELDDIRLKYRSLIAEAYEKEAIFVTSYSGLGYYLSNFEGEGKVKRLDRNRIQISSEAYRNKLDLLKAPIEETEVEWDKLIGNIKARSSVKKALAYLHEIGIDTTEVEEKFAKKEVEALPPATIINLNMLALKKEDEDK